MRAGERPRAILDSADCSILHLYLPEATVQRAANDLFDRSVSFIELLPVAIEADASIKALADAIVREIRDPEPASTHYR